MSNVRIGAIGLMIFLTAAVAQAQRGPASRPASQPAVVTPIDYTKLKEWLPAQAAGIQRTTHEGENIAVATMAMSNARAEYSRANASDKDPRVTIEVMDYGASPMMLAGMAAWRQVPMKIENDQGYQRTVTFKNLPAFQSYTKEGENRQMFVVVAERYLVNVQTYYVSETDFTTLAEGLQWDKLAALK